MSRLEPVLAESDRFERSLTALFEQHRWAAFSDEPRLRTSFASALLSLEHAGMVRLAFTSGSPSSGSALLRLQFECLLKSAWVLHIAIDTQVSRLTDVLTQTTEQAAKIFQALPISWQHWYRRGHRALRIHFRGFFDEFTGFEFLCSWWYSSCLTNEQRLPA